MEKQHLFDLLLDCLHSDPSRVDNDRLAALTDADWDRFLSIATEQRVRALLFYWLKARKFLDSVPGDVHYSLEEFYRMNASRNLRYYGELYKISKAFQEASIPVIVLKGAYLADVIYPNIALREMNDIDLLVQKSDLEQAANILMEMAYQPLYPFSLDWKFTSNHLPPFIKPNVASVEIHWSIIKPELSPKFSILDFWNLAEPVKIANTEMLSLAPEDVLLYLCFHNAKHAFAFSLRPYCDIHAVIVHFSSAINWDKVIERARKWGWGRGAYLSLRLSAEFVGVEIPEYVLVALKPKHDIAKIHAMALAQTFSDKKRVLDITPHMANFSQMTAWERVILLVRRFFPSRLEMANTYNTAPDSWVVLFKYPIRWKDVFIRQFIMLSKNQSSDERLSELIERKGEIVKWLSEG